MVAGGSAISGYTDSVEIVDLESTKSNCGKLASLPAKVFAPTGILGDDGKAVVCGGTLNNTLYNR
jgi:hypothetical protein